MVVLGQKEDKQLYNELVSPPGYVFLGIFWRTEQVPTLLSWCRLPFSLDIIYLAKFATKMTNDKKVVMRVSVVTMSEL